jgi:hypothetical protein
MSREKIRVPAKIYEELVALQREIHFTLDHNDTIKRAEDRGYLAAADWIRRNENAYKVGFSWGFEPDAEEPRGTLKDIPQRSEPAPQRTFRPRGADTISAKKEPKSITTRIRAWLGRYF